MRKLLLILMIPILLFSSCNSKENATLSPEPEILYLRYADNQPDDYPTTRAARYFAKLVEERTEGRIQIDVYPDGVMGSEVSVLEQMRFGGIDFARFSLGILSDEYPELAVLTLPYIYRDKSHMWKVLDSEIGDYYLNIFPDKQVEGLAWFDAGARSFYTRKPVHTLEDLEGLRIRVQETDLMMRMFALLNVEPVKVPYGDVYSALQKNLVDGAENNIPSYYHTGHYEQSPYFFRSEHMRLPELMMMSYSARERIAEFDPKLLDIVRECAKEAGEYERVQWEHEELNAIRYCIDNGVEIIRPSSEERYKLKFAIEEIYEEFSEYDEVIRKIQSM